MPLSHLPSGIVMTAENLVDAAVAGLDQNELVTIPALTDQGEWDRYEATRRGIATQLSGTEPAARYGIKTLANASLNPQQEEVDRRSARAAESRFMTTTACFRRLSWIADCRVEVLVSFPGCPPCASP